MTKAVKTPGSAYETYPGISREDAEKKGLAVVEYNYSGGAPTPVYGRYLDAPAGSGLGITVPAPEDTEVIGGGSVGPDLDADGGKGEAFKPVNPIVHSEPGENMHEDGGKPGTNAETPQEPKPGKK